MILKSCLTNHNRSGAYVELSSMVCTLL